MKNGMHRLSLALAFALFLFPAALPPANAEHSGGHGAGHDTGGHAEEALLLGETEVEGVRAEARLNQVAEAMAKAGRSETHHLQILFTETATGKTVTAGVAAVKITPPGGEEGPAQPLAGMEGHFGADLTLTRPGLYRLAVGARLADGRKRLFVFRYGLP